MGSAHNTHIDYLEIAHDIRRSRSWYVRQSDQGRLMEEIPTFILSHVLAPLASNAAIGRRSIPAV
jgi:hypothetical protein